MLQRELPTHAQHEIVFYVPYFKVDGAYAGSTDGQFLSVGYAQYNPSHLSAKVFRYSDETERWKRNSEELPIHRVLDLAKMIVVAQSWTERKLHAVGLPRVEVTSMSSASNISKQIRKDGHVMGRLEELANLLYEAGFCPSAQRNPNSAELAQGSLPAETHQDRVEKLRDAGLLSDLEAEMLRTRIR